MNKKYYINRISNEWDVQYSLFLNEKLDCNYISIGWANYLNENVLEVSRNGNLEGFNELMDRLEEKSRSRWNMWYFAQYKVGDILVVPLYDKEFAICEVLELGKSVAELDGLEIKTIKGDKVVFSSCGAMQGERLVDVGFVVKVRIINRIPRSYAKPDLISRMKIRSALADISDLEESINDAIKATKVFDFSESIVNHLADQLLNRIVSDITPDGFEELVRWYMEKKGADIALIPSKNESGKMDNADADIIAIFEDLKTVYYIQAKKHTGETDEWAVQQIYKYKNQKEDINNDYTYIPWVISTASFSEVAVESAQSKGVRLIGGHDFAKMLINIGLNKIDQVKNIKSNK